MPRIGSLQDIADVEQLYSDSNRFVDLAVRLRVLGEGDAPGRLLPGIIGGRWDRRFGEWVTPRPDNLQWIEWTIQEQQIPTFLLPPDAMLAAVFAGRQAGKTEDGLMLIAAGGFRYPARESFIVSLDFKASRTIEQSFLNLIPPQWQCHWEKTERILTFPHGHAVKFRSAENAAACRGPSTKAILLDEAALMPEEVFHSAVGSGMASQDFLLVITTTPRRESKWIRDVYRTWGSPELPGSYAFHLETEKNPRRNHKLLELIKSMTPADLYDQEMRGLLVAPQNAAYGHLFNRKLHLRHAGMLPDSVREHLLGIKDITRDWTERYGGGPADYVGGWDFGKEAVVIGKVYQDARKIDGRIVKRNRLWIIGSEVDKQTSTDQHAAKVAAKWGTSIGFITDAMGAYDKSTGRGNTDDAAPITLLREHGFAWVEPVATKNPPVEFRQRTVCRALRSCVRGAGAVGAEEWPDTDQYPGGEVRLFVVPDAAPEVVDALENQAMKNGKPAKDGEHEHVADALGYLVMAVLPLEESLPDGWESVLTDEED